MSLLAVKPGSYVLVCNVNFAIYSNKIMVFIYFSLLCETAL